MGTYTTNYILFMPSIGEQGWGDLVNGNFSIIDTTIKGLDTRMGTLETEGDAVAARVGTLETKVSDIEGEVNGDLVCNSVTANAFNGNVQGNNIGLLFVPGVVQSTEGDVAYATFESQNFAITTSHTASNPYTVTVNAPTIVYDLPHKHTWGVYTRLEDLSGDISITGITRSYWFPSGGTTRYLYYKLSSESTYSRANITQVSGGGLYLTAGKTYDMYAVTKSTNLPTALSWTFSSGTPLYVKYATP